MNNLIYKGIVEDIRSDKCSDSEIEKLLEVFTRAIGYFTNDLSEKYWENLNDFFDPDKSEISNFSLKIQKKLKGSVFQYIGEFKSNAKNLKIYAKSSN
jgi:ribosomal protein S17E